MSVMEGVRILAWEDPPPVGSGKKRTEPSEYDEVVTDLRDNPERWAKVMESDNIHRAHQLTARINGGKILAFRGTTDGEFHAVSRQNPDTGLAAVYVRYGRDIKPKSLKREGMADAN